MPLHAPIPTRPKRKEEKKNPQKKQKGHADAKGQGRVRGYKQPPCGRPSLQHHNNSVVSVHVYANQSCRNATRACVCLPGRRCMYTLSGLVLDMVLGCLMIKVWVMLGAGR